MTAQTISIPETLYQRLQRAARLNKATEDDLSQLAILEFLERNYPENSIIGLFADHPDMIDDVMDDVKRSRESDTLRPIQ